jgi:hypothetical protein
MNNSTNFWTAPDAAGRVAPPRNSGRGYASSARLAIDAGWLAHKSIRLFIGGL